jgi:hypothetical protein
MTRLPEVRAVCPPGKAGGDAKGTTSTRALLDHSLLVRRSDAVGRNLVLATTNHDTIARVGDVEGL